MSPTNAQLAALKPKLQLLLGERVSFSESVRAQHSHGEDYHPPQLPDAVCFVQTTEEVSAILTACYEHDIPVVPWGAGTSVEGHVVATRGGVSLDLSRMDQVLEVNPLDMDCRVQAGIPRSRVNEYLRDTGLFFSVDPGADATVGGMVSTRASGTNTVRYGTIRENVLSLKVVLANGDIIETGTRARKSAAGYDLTHLFIGAEGTLGVVTEVQLRLHPQPEAVAAAVCQFETLDGAVDTVIETLAHAIPVARIELLDDVQMRACIAYSKLDEFKPVPTLFFEFNGTGSSVPEQMAVVEEIAQGNGGSAFQSALREEERSRLWKARHSAYYAIRAMAAGRTGLTTDVCVPISALAENIHAARADIDACGLMASILGHVGDGNFHCALMVDPEQSEEVRIAKEVGDRIVERALASGGTCTGEHGVGLGKREWVERERGSGMAVLRAIKQALDPKGLMNPDKMIKN